MNASVAAGMPLSVFAATADTVQLCLDERIAVVVLVPAEGSAFRSYAPAVEETHLNAVRQLTQELGVPLVDARTWVDDDGFYTSIGDDGNTNDHTDDDREKIWHYSLDGSGKKRGRGHRA